MSQQNDAAALPADVLAPDRAPEHVAIFSAPAVEVVNHWWAECNKRWAERDRLKAQPATRANCEPQSRAAQQPSNFLAP